jgi:hypothetical protein
MVVFIVQFLLEIRYRAGTETGHGPHYKSKFSKSSGNLRVERECYLAAVAAKVGGLEHAI